MRTLEHMPRHKQVAIARETLQIFVPLARRLGIETLERELTDISVEYIFPEELKGVFGLELLGHWARIRFWGALDGLLLRDTVLSELDVDSKLDDHRERRAQARRLLGRRLLQVSRISPPSSDGTTSSALFSAAGTDDGAESTW